MFANFSPSLFPNTEANIMKIPGSSTHIYRNDANGAPKTSTPDLDSVTNLQVVASQPKKTQDAWKGKESVRDKSKWLWMKKLGYTATENVKNPFKAPPDTGHFIQGLPYKLSESTPPEVRTYIETTLCNLNHESLEQLQNRARAFLRHRFAEQTLLEQTSAALKDETGTSKELQQSAWMTHVQRAEITQAGIVGTPIGRHLARSYANLNSAGFDYSKGRQRAKVSPPTGQVMSMFLSGKEGPLTLEQSSHGAEIALAVHLLTKEIAEIPNREDVKGLRISAQRPVDPSISTSPWKAENGLDLSLDKGTKIHDELGLPVMTGLSGTASDMALSHVHASDKQGVPHHPPELDKAEAEQVMIDLAFHYMRTGVLPAFIANAINRNRNFLGAPSKSVEPESVQTHSYPEVNASMEWSFQRAMPNEAGLRASAEKAAERLLRAEQSRNENNAE